MFWRRDMSLVHRIYVQKKEDYAVEEKSIFMDIVNNLQIKGLKQLHLINRYDVQGIDENTLKRCKQFTQ